MLKTQISGKKGNHSSQKKFLTNFSGIIECHKPQATNNDGAKGVLTNTVEVIKSSLTPKVLLKTQFFEKKSKLSSEENILAYFLSCYRV